MRYKSLPIEQAVQSLYNELRIILTFGSGMQRGKKLFRVNVGNVSDIHPVILIR
jgi:hypothetical protein